MIHLGPVAREIDTHQALALTPDFLGITPQGWMREWPMERGGRVRHVPLRLPPELLGRTDTIVVSDEEIAQARSAVEWVGARRIGVVTLGPNGCNLLYAGHRAELPGYPVKTVDLTGAGDVFAAAFFVKAADQRVSPVTAGPLRQPGGRAQPARRGTGLRAADGGDRGTLRRLGAKDNGSRLIVFFAIPATMDAEPLTDERGRGAWSTASIAWRER